MKILLLALLIFLIPHKMFSQEWQSSKVVVTDSSLSYPSDEGMNRLPDFSHAGYKSGTDPIPELKVVETISPIKGDNTQHIQQALDRAAALPMDATGHKGAVLLSEGVYEIHGTLYLNSSGVVLRGAGDGAQSQGNSILLARGNTPPRRSIIVAGGGENTLWKGEVEGSRTPITTNFVQVGSFQFEVADASAFQPGDNIIIHHPATREWMEAIGQLHWKENEYNIIYNRRITDISDKSITIDAPVYNHLDRSLSPSFIYKYDRMGLVTDIGIEDLRIQIEHSDTLETHARNAIVLKQVENAWVRNSSFLHFVFSGVMTETARFVTIENCQSLEPKGRPMGGRFYNFNAGNASNEILFKNCTATGARHAFVANGTSEASGIVVYNSTSLDPLTSSEAHRHWTSGMLFDNFRDSGSLPTSNEGRVLGFYNRGDYGTYHGWTNAHSVVWNSDLRREKGPHGKAVIQKPRTAQNYAIGSFGNFTDEGPFPGELGYLEGIGKADIFPGSLYQAQLKSRMQGQQPVFPEINLDSIPRNIHHYPLLFRDSLLLDNASHHLGAYAIFDEQEQLVESSEKSPNRGLGSSLPPGIYSLNIAVDGRIVSKKLIKQN